MEKELTKRLEAIEKNCLLAAKNVLTIDDVVLLTGLTKGHIYRLTWKKEIPYYKRNSKLMYFSRSEIEAWMLQNRIGTHDEAEQSAAAYCLTH